MLPYRSLRFQSIQISHVIRDIYIVYIDIYIKYYIAFFKLSRGKNSRLNNFLCAIISRGAIPNISDIFFYG